MLLLEFSDIQTTFIVLMALSASIASFYGVYKVVKELSKPNKERDEHLNSLDSKVKHLEENHDADLIEINKKLAVDKAELIKLGRGQKVMLKADLTLIEHILTENGATELKSMKKEIQAYLLDDREQEYR